MITNESREPHGSLALCFQKGFVFVGGGAADVAHSRQFADVQLPVLMGRIVEVKGGEDFLLCDLRADAHIRP